MRTIFELLTKLPDFIEDDEINLYALASVDNWPSFSEDIYKNALNDDALDDDTKSVITYSDWFDEPVDLENVELLEVTDDYLIINGGGDWQFPSRITIGVKDDKLTVLETKFFQTYEEGSEEVYQLLEEKLKNAS